MRHTFNLAKRGGKLLHGPHVPRLREDNVRTGFFTREEVERLCACLPEPYSSFTLFGFLTGWRYSEIQKLEWRNVDLERGEIRIDVGKDKSRAGRVFPMSDELRGLLEALARTGTTVAERVSRKVVPAKTPEYVFHLHGRPIGAFRKTWKTANHKAGLPCVVNTAGKVLKAVRTSRGGVVHPETRSYSLEIQENLRCARTRLGHDSPYPTKKLWEGELSCVAGRPGTI